MGLIVGMIIDASKAGPLSGNRLFVNDIVLIGNRASFEPYILPSRRYTVDHLSETKGDTATAAVGAAGRLSGSICSSLSPEALRLRQILQPFRRAAACLRAIRAHQRPFSERSSNRRFSSCGRCIQSNALTTVPLFRMKRRPYPWTATRVSCLAALSTWHERQR